MIEITEKFPEQVIKKRPEDSYKGTFGKTVLIGGNQQYGGAIIMSAEACVHSGAGLTTVVTHEKNHGPLHTRLPEAMVVGFEETELIKNVIKEADVVLIGPGLGLKKEALTLLKLVLSLQQEQWYVIDGSAITLFAQEGLSMNTPQKTIFTPHQIEWQRLSGIPLPEQSQKPNQTAQQALDAMIVLKSHRTELYTSKEVYRNTTGNPGMATGGQGDTLAGIITGFLAQFEKSPVTVAAAIYLHSKIGDDSAKENYLVLPTEISRKLPKYMHSYANKELD